MPTAAHAGASPSSCRVAYPPRMSPSRCALLAVACWAFASCKPRKYEPPTETVTDLPTQLPSPESKGEEYAVGDDVSILDENGRFEVEVRVTAVTTAPRMYTVRSTNRRSSLTKVLRPSQVFPPPWASAARVRVGDTIYERRFGNFAPSKCVAKVVPADVHGGITAECDGTTRTQFIARKDTFFAFEPATPGTLSVGDIVYYEKMSWVMVVGTSQPDGRVAIRSAGFAAKDQLVSLASIQRVR